MKKIFFIAFCFISVAVFSQNPDPLTTTSAILPSEGFSLGTLWRGVLGMFSLLVIAFLFGPFTEKLLSKEASSSKLISSFTAKSTPV